MNIRKIIREEMDDLGWIKDIDPRGMDFRIGDIIKVHNVGDEESFLNWLGDYGRSYLNNKYGEFITGSIVDIEDKRIEIQEFNTDDYIYFPTYNDFEYLRNSAGLGGTTYKNLDVYYEILNH